MTRISLTLLVLHVPGLVVPAAPAYAQVPYEALGSRALGMAGAFVAVADDITAAYWNPAGLATGPAIGGTFEWSRFQKRDPNQPAVPGAGLDTATFTGAGSLPLGITYGRLTSVSVVGDPAGPLSVERLSVSQLGGTFIQTLVPGLIVGTTLKYLRGTVSEGPFAGATGGEAVDVVAAYPERTTSEFDFDVGLLADLDQLRIGVTFKNLMTPEFQSVAENVITVPRFVRLGLAVRPGAGLTLAMDLDLDTVDLRDGLRRMLAFGAEGPVGSRLALRGGVRWDLEGDREPVTAAGVSLGLTERFWLDGHYSYGHSDGNQGFGFALRAGY